MLNLYLAPKSWKAPAPGEDRVEALLGFLDSNAIIGGETEPGEYPPGADVAVLYHGEAAEALLPAELTFDCLRIESSGKARFLPQSQRAADFDRPRCTVCEDDLDAAGLDESMRELAYFPVERFGFTCPSCRTELTLREIDFGQTVAIARFWLFVEGAATSRLNASLLHEMERHLGLPLVVVPEVPPERVEDWAPARKLRP